MPESSPNALDDLWSRQQAAFGPIKTVSRTRPSCGDANDATPPSPYSLGMWTVKACRSCGFTYIDTAPDYEALFQQMSWEKSGQVEVEWRESTRGLQQRVSKKMRWRQRILPRKRMPELLARYAEPGNIVDLGCGDGEQLEGIGDAFVPHGVEISQEAAAKANARFRTRDGCAVNAPCLEGLREFPDAYFSAATLRSYLEHELHPKGVLGELHRVLKPAGTAIVRQPTWITCWSAF